jgi:3-deoxy-D-manno-octulosonate 8-phosphate phosphatase (KDO 8-P phosphatase)
MTGDTELEARFSKLGGVFLTPTRTLRERLQKARGVVCDWDGVFNSGAKGEGAASTYSEADSMGANLLRYALWREHGRVLPVTALITGVENPTARAFAAREHFHALYSSAKNKTVAVEDLCAAHRLSSDQLICVFDDVNDLGMAFGCGIRVLVRRDASPLFHDYVMRYDLCDYVTGLTPAQYAVREVCELLLGVLGTFDAVVGSRVAWDDDYVKFFAARQAVVTQFVDRLARG